MRKIKSDVKIAMSTVKMLVNISSAKTEASAVWTYVAFVLYTTVVSTVS